MKLLFVYLSFISLLLGQDFLVSTTEQFRKALNDAAANGSNDTIILNSGVYAVSNDNQGTFKFSDVEDFNLTIVAKEGLSSNDIILDGNMTNQVLNLTSTSPKTVFKIKGVTLTKGKVNNAGAGVYANRALILENTIIDKNEQTSNSGGGGIYSTVSLDITDSTISNNNAVGGGGAINTPILTIARSVVFNNKSTSSTSYGGGILANQINMSDCNISNNIITNNDGGGISTSLDSTINNSVIEGNSANDGGGIFVRSDSTLKITNSKILNNKGVKNGGGIRAYTAIVDNTFFSENSVTNSYAYALGGAIYSTKNMMITRSVFNGNSALSNGSAIYSLGNLFLINSLFINNNITRTDILDNGMIEATNNAYIFNNTFLNNIDNALKIKGLIINNLFTSNDNDLYVSGDSYLYNNYVDNSKIKNQANYTIINKNQLSQSNTLDLSTEGKPQEGSLAINAGLNPSDSVFLMQIDKFFPYILANGKYSTSSTDTLGSTICNAYCMDNNATRNFIGSSLQSDLSGNARISSDAIDVGAYEFGSFVTKPNLDQLSLQLDTKIYFPFTLSLSEKAGTDSAVSYAIDWGSGNFEDINTLNPQYVFSKDEDVTIRVKATNALTGESTIKEIDVVISPLNMTETINLCKTNPSLCGISVVQEGALTSSDISGYGSGWRMVGTPTEITDFSIFADAQLLWYYDYTTQEWKAKAVNNTDLQNQIKNAGFNEPTTLPAKSGFWIKK